MLAFIENECNHGINISYCNSNNSNNTNSSNSADLELDIEN